MLAFPERQAPLQQPGVVPKREPNMSTTRQQILRRIQEAKAKKHKKLYLSSWGKKLTKIPEEVFELDHLEELVLRNHAITIIPDQIKQLKQLKMLSDLICL